MRALRSFLTTCILVLCSSSFTTAQFTIPQQVYSTIHRPTGYDWQELKSPHFRVIYPSGLDSLARRTAMILEQQYPKASQLTGGSLSNFPVVLTTYNDLTNGFVTPLNFRSEFDAAPFKGKSLNPKSGDWLETVLPHELVHALQGNVTVAGSSGSLIRLISPDFARSVNFYPPVGVHEGLAVHHESTRVFDNGGRNNYPYYINQFSANVASNDPWSAGQIFQTSGYTLPLNRHYISGSAFTRWLHQTYGEEVSNNAIRYHYKYFFLGYGFALKQVTGKWPSELYADYIAAQKQNERMRQNDIGTSTQQHHQILETPFKGVRLNRPIWTSPSTIAYHGIHYNGIRGLYSYDLNSKKASRIKELFAVADYSFDLSLSRNEMLVSEYLPERLYNGAYKATPRIIALEDGSMKSIANQDRIYSPTFAKDGYLALQTHLASADVVHISTEGEVTTLAHFTGAHPVEIKTNPSNPDQIALIVNRRGLQALWLTTPSTIQQDVLQAPNIAFEDASIFDISWHPNEQKLLFSSDKGEALNIYELNLTTGDVLQLTNALFNAFEGSYSPDGSAIAFIQQGNQEQKIAVLREEQFYNQRVARDQFLQGSDLRSQLEKPLLGSELSTEAAAWPTKKYGDASWLKPRTILPVLKDRVGTLQFGASLQSIDVLRSQQYYAEITGIQDRLWYDLRYSNKTFWPGFKVRAYSNPSFGVFADVGGSPFSYMLQERGFSFEVPMTFDLNSTTRSRYFYFSPKLTTEQFRYFDLAANSLSDFESQYKAGFYSQLSWNVLSLTRSVQPVAGVSLFGFLDHALNDPDIIIDFGNNNRGAVTLNNRWAAYYGINGYVSPLRKYNQSLKWDIQFLQQSDDLLYSVSTIIPEAFSSDAFRRPTNTSQSFNNLARFSTRYTIPLVYADDGGMLLPLYLRSIYLTTFSHTITDLNQSDLVEASRSVIGAGIHFQLNLSNINIDLGFGISYEPTRSNSKFVFGDF